MTPPQLWLAQLKFRHLHRHYSSRTAGTALSPPSLSQEHQTAAVWRLIIKPLATDSQEMERNGLIPQGCNLLPPKLRCFGKDPCLGCMGACKQNVALPSHSTSVIPSSKTLQEGADVKRIRRSPGISLASTNHSKLECQQSPLKYSVNLQSLCRRAVWR